MLRTKGLVESVPAIALLTITCLPLTQIHSGEKELTKHPQVLTKRMGIERDDDEMGKVLKARYNETVTITATIYEEYRLGRLIACDTLLDAGRRLTRAGMDLHGRPAERVEFLTQMEEFAKYAHRIMEANRSPQSIKGMQQPEKIREFALETQIQLLKAKKAAIKEKK